MFGSFAFAPVTQRLNSGYRRLDPVSSNETAELGAFASRLCSVAPEVVVAVVLFVGALVVGDELVELHAASDTADHSDGEEDVRSDPHIGLLPGVCFTTQPIRPLT